MPQHKKRALCVITRNQIFNLIWFTVGTRLPGTASLFQLISISPSSQDCVVWEGQPLPTALLSGSFNWEQPPSLFLCYMSILYTLQSPAYDVSTLVGCFENITKMVLRVYTHLYSFNDVRISCVFSSRTDKVAAGKDHASYLPYIPSADSWGLETA